MPSKIIATLNSPTTLSSNADWCKGWFDLLILSISEVIPEASIDWCYPFTEHLYFTDQVLDIKDGNYEHPVMCVSVSSLQHPSWMLWLIDQMLIHTDHWRNLEPMVKCMVKDMTCLVRDYEYQDHSLSYEMNPVIKKGWRLVLPNIDTSALIQVRHALPSSALVREYAKDEFLL
jgi:hypothetical protein